MSNTLRGLMSTDTSPAEPQEHADSPLSSDASERKTNKDEMTLLDILVILAERKKLIVTITAASAIVAIIVSFILPARYTATVTILPPQQNASLSSALASQVGALGGMAALAGGSLGLKNSNDMFVAMLKSRSVEQAVVQRFGLMSEYKTRYLSDAQKAFEKHATVDGSGKDGLIHISVEDRNPNRAAELANGYVDQFRNLSEHLAITEASQRRLFLEQQLEKTKDNLDNAEEALKRTEQKTGMIQLDSQARALIETAVALHAQITAKEVEIQSLRTFATDQNAQLLQAQQELNSLRVQLAKLGGNEDDPESSLIMSKGRVPEAGLEYVRKLRDVKYQQTIFDILARQFEIAKLDEAKEGALIQVMDPAVPPDKRSSPRRALLVSGLTIVGFILGIFAALVQGGLQRLQEDAETRRKLNACRRALSFRS